MKILQFFFTLITFVTIAYSQDEYKKWAECQQRLFKQPNVFNVVGEATANLKPSIGIVNFLVETKDQNAGEALKQNTQMVESAIISVTALSGVNQDTILTTSDLQIYPEYQYVNGQQVFQNYVVRKQLTVKTKMLELLGEFIDTGIKSGLSRINNINFELAPEMRNKAELGLIGDAIQDAENKAKLALDALGYEIGGYQSLSFETYTQPRYYQQEEFMPMADMEMEDGVNAKTQVFSGDQDVKMKLRVGFLINQKQ